MNTQREWNVSALIRCNDGSPPITIYFGVQNGPNVVFEIADIIEKSMHESNFVVHNVNSPDVDTHHQGKFQIFIEVHHPLTVYIVRRQIR